MRLYPARQLRPAPRRQMQRTTAFHRRGFQRDRLWQRAQQPPDCVWHPGHSFSPRYPRATVSIAVFSFMACASNNTNTMPCSASRRICGPTRPRMLNRGAAYTPGCIMTQNCRQKTDNAATLILSLFTRIFCARILGEPASIPSVLRAPYNRDTQRRPK